MTNIKTTVAPENLQSAHRGRGARIAGLTLREAELLELLANNRNKLNTPFFRGESERGWCRPRDIGGTRQSNHSNTLNRLVRRGFVSKKAYTSEVTPSSIYRISEKGQEAWSIYSEHRSQLNVLT